MSALLKYKTKQASLDAFAFRNLSKNKPCQVWKQKRVCESQIFTLRKTRDERWFTEMIKSMSQRTVCVAALRCCFKIPDVYIENLFKNEECM